MAEIDPRYKRGKIYCVRCRYDDSLIYVGSTINTLAKRMGKHRKDKLCSLYQYVDNDWDNWYIELYEYYPCNNKPELNKREGEVQRQIATINKNVAGRTKKEQQKQYRQNNRDKLLENMKQYHLNNREKRLEQRKQYHQVNREKDLEYYKQYHQDNREKILEQQKQKITCDHCGSIVNKNSISKHKRTQKCMNFKPS
jgi:hypothetical protein